MTMSNHPLVSIIIATYNAAGTIGSCLSSIASQEFTDWELIVMDGGSQDNTVEILREYESIIAHWRSEPDRGIYHAWNKAIAEARGEWVVFIGADDAFVDPSSLGAMVLIAEEDVDLVFGNVAIVNAEGERRRVMGEPWNWERLTSFQKVAHPGALHRRRLFKRFGPFVETYRIAGDYDFLLRLGPKMKTAYLDRIILNCGDGGVSHAQQALAIKETRDIQAKHALVGWTKAWARYVWTRTKILLRRTLEA